MSTTATVIRVTQVAKFDEARTPLDIVVLDYQGGAYFWDSEPGTYAVGQQIPVNPPAHPGANITPASGETSSEKEDGR